jgi:hypothetical protein
MIKKLMIVMALIVGKLGKRKSVQITPGYSGGT